MANLLSPENPIFSSFMFYTMAVLLKTFFLQISIIYSRITRKVFNTPEDLKVHDPSGKIKVIKNDEVVERHRNAHLNDMENIFPFVLVGLGYITTNPAASTAIMLFRIFTTVRYIHTIVYLFQVRQPFRGLAFMSGFAVMVYMAVSTLIHYMSYM